MAPVKTIKTPSVSDTPKFGRVTDVFRLFSLPELPYITRVSFRPLIAYWESQKDSESPVPRMVARKILQKLKPGHELYDPVEDVDRLGKHTELIELLTSVFFPSNNEHQMVRFSGPFNTLSFYHSPTVARLIKDKLAHIDIDKDPEKVKQFLIIRAGCIILKTFYGRKLNINQPYTFTLNDPATGLDFHMQTSIDDRFVEVIQTAPLKELTEADIHALLGNVSDTERWLKLLPPENFEFHGVISTILSDVTESETLSRLKSSLLKPDAVVSPEKMKELERQLRTFFNQPDLRVGLFATDYPDKGRSVHQSEISHGFLSEEFPKLFSRKYENSVYEQTCKRRDVTLVEDLAQYPNSTQLKTALLDKGIRSLLLAPITDEHQQVVGILELGSPYPYRLNSFTVLKLRQVLPVIAVALIRSRNEIDNQIAAIIRDKFTALHPSVEWRFMEDAYRELHASEEEPIVENGRILFPDVYPLYGQADIVGSTVRRNKAVQSDLIQNLYQVKKFLKLALRHINFPLVEKLELEADLYIKTVKQQMTPTSEFQVTEFIKQEVHPTLRALRKKAPPLREAYQAYFDQLDPQMGIVYDKRKEYDDSVHMVNKVFSLFFEKEDIKAQNMIPHYFEKFQTDGVAYNIYVGQSLLEKGKFKPLHLYNLRLWQLIKMCEAIQLFEKVKPKLPVAMDTAQLILVHSQPLAIEFRMDEKRFDVAGTYNARFEITKKRIDKAIIEGTNERLTVAGKIAIVYQQEKDRTEYLRYLDFLVKKDLITRNIEKLELKKMQGVQGLKALRITVKV